jgi:hypothetical protein
LPCGVRADPTHKAVREVVARAISDPAAILKGLGEPQRAEVQTLFHSDKLLAMHNAVLAEIKSWRVI